MQTFLLLLSIALLDRNLSFTQRLSFEIQLVSLPVSPSDGLKENYKNTAEPPFAVIKSYHILCSFLKMILLTQAVHILAF